MSGEQPESRVVREAASGVSQTWVQTQACHQLVTCTAWAATSPGQLWGPHLHMNLRAVTLPKAAAGAQQEQVCQRGVRETGHLVSSHRRLLWAVLILITDVPIMGTGNLRAASMGAAGACPIFLYLYSFLLPPKVSSHVHLQ